MSGHEDEAILIQRVVEGERAAFTVLYSRYINSLYRYIYLFTKSKETSEDIVQNVFIKIWERRASLKNLSSFKAYLYHCAKNLMLDEIRRNQVREKVFLIVKDGMEEAVDELEADIMYGEYYQLAQQAIDMLPEKRRQIVEMRIKEDLSLDEIAAKLNISKFVVKKQMYMGLHFVKSYLKKYAELTLYLTLFTTLVSCN